MNNGNSKGGEKTCRGNSQILLKARSLIFEVSCGEMQELLAAAGIPMLVLKGPHVAATLYENPADRDYCDLDILVKPEHYLSAALVLIKNGFSLFKVNRRRLASEKADYQMLLRAPRGVAVELHRALADRDQFRSDVHGFFQRAQEFAFGEVKVRGLGNEDLLLHLCLHFGKRHFMTSEKKHLVDIALLLKKKNIAWPVFLERTRRSRCRTVAYYCLNAAAQQHGSELPAQVLASLRPMSWRKRFLDTFLDPASFPLYRLQDARPGWRERTVNLLLLDRLSTMIFSGIRFGGRSAMNLLLRAGALRRLWMKGNPLAEWME
ncbi:MAG: nucleotidyltransferase family protein [Chrysiogenia bacterium]